MWLSLVENAPTVIAVVDREGAIQFANRAARAMSVDEEIRRSVYDYIRPEYHDIAKRAIEHVFETGESSEYEASAEVSGDRRWYRGEVGMVEENGEVIAASLIAIDITERRQAQAELRKTTHDLGERVKELNCLYGISNLIERPGMPLRLLLQGIADLTPSAWQHPDIACARISLGQQQARTEPFTETKWEQTRNILVRGDRVGSVSVFYREERPERDEGPFVKEEGLLLDAIAERVGRLIESKQDEDELRASEEIHRVFVNSSFDGVICVDAQMRITMWNPAAKRIFGYTEGEIVGQSLLQIVPEGAREAVKAGFAVIAQDGAGSSMCNTFETRGLRRDGSEVPIELSVSYADGAGVRMGTAVARDITERVEQERERRIRDSAMTTAINAIVMADLEGKMTYANQAFLRMWGYDEDDEVLGRSAVGFWEMPDEVTRIVDRLRDEVSYVGELTARRRDGSLFDAELSASMVRDPDGEPIGIMGAFVDITARKRAEEALRNSERKQRELVESLHEGIWSVDRDANTTYVNPRMAEMLGESAEGIRGKSLYGFMDADALKVVRSYLDSVRQGIGQRFDCELCRKDGARLHASVAISPMADEQGDIVGATAAVADITARVQLEEHLREAQRELEQRVEERTAALQAANDRLRLEIVQRARAEEDLRQLKDFSEGILQAMTEALIVRDEEGIVTFVNPAMEELAGLEAGSLVGRHWLEIVPDADTQQGRTGITRQPASGAERYEALLHLGEDREVPVLVSTAPLCEEGKLSGVLAALTDITEWKQAEQATQQRMEELIVLQALASAGAEATSEDELLDRATEIMSRVRQGDCVRLQVRDETSGTLRASYARQLCGEDVAYECLSECALVQQVMADGQARRISNLSCEADCLVSHLRGCSGLCVPLKVGDGTVGVISVASASQGGFDYANQRVVETFARQIAMAVERVRLLERLRKRAEDRAAELSALYDVTAVTTEFVDLATALEWVLNRSLAAMNSQMGAIYLLDEAGRTLSLAAQKGEPPDLVAEQDVAGAAHESIRSVLESGLPMVGNLAMRILPADEDAHNLADAPVVYAAVPVRSRGQVIGLLCALRQGGPCYHSEEVALLVAMADQTGIVVENARLREVQRRAAVMAERERVAGELHDSVTQLMYSVALLAEAGQEEARLGDWGSVVSTVKQIGAIAQETLREMRLLLYELRPQALEAEGLAAALEHRLSLVEEHVGVHTDLAVEIPFELPIPLGECLYYVSAEALNNALRHSGATAVSVTIRASGDAVELEVTDDGCGFDWMEEDVGRRGMGLANMRARVEALGGTLCILSTPGEGSTVRATVDVMAWEKNGDDGIDQGVDS